MCNPFYAQPALDMCPFLKIIKYHLNEITLFKIIIKHYLNENLYTSSNINHKCTKSNFPYIWSLGCI